VCQPPDRFVFVRGDVPFQLRRAKRIAQLVQRSARDLQKPGELLVLATKSFRDVAAHRIHRVFRLRMELEIAREAVSPCQLEHQDPDLIGELPHNQVLIPSCAPHIAARSTTRAPWISLRIDFATTKPCRTCNANPARSAHLLHRPGSDSHRPGSDLHRPGSDSHRPGSDSHRPGSDSHRPGSDLHRPGSDSHRPGSDLRRPGSDSHRPNAHDL
jgi:hypothetical protein